MSKLSNNLLLLWLLLSRLTMFVWRESAEEACRTHDAEAAGTALSQAVPIIDKMVTKGIMHKNQAARQKSRLNKRVKALSA